MSQKILHSLTDEKTDLHKQIGCMSGIFQLFDRHHFLAGRRINGNSHKRLPPGEIGNHAVEPNSTLQKATDKNRKKEVKERERISTESSRTSVSSSCSSLEYAKAAQQEPSSLSSQTNFNEKHNPYRSINQPNASMHLRRRSFDMQDLAKDSTYREARSISVKPAAKDGNGHTLRYTDSPRPSVQSKSVKPRVSGVNESFQVPAKFRQGPWCSNEEKDGCMRFVPKDARRFSYDGKESRDTSKSTIKLKELPRLSLDSRERSIRRGCNPESKPNHFKDLQREDGNCNKILELQHEPGSSKRPSNVVAKLMGLDLSDSVSTTASPLRLINTSQSDRSDPLSRSSRATNENKPDFFSGVFLGNLQKDTSSPQRRSTDSVMKPTTHSKFPIETAPWRHPHGSKGSQRLALKYQEPTKAPNSPSSVYGEMEKRLANLEFTKSGKDLRALKQILEAMQKTKQMLDNRKDQASNFASQESNKSILSGSTGPASQRNIQSDISVPAIAKNSQSPKSLKSPTIIMKPAKLIEKPHSSASTVVSMGETLGLPKLRTSSIGDNRKGLVDKKTAKDLTPRNNHITDPFNRRLCSADNNSNTRTLRSAQNPKVSVSQNISEEKATSSSRSSGITSPRLQQRKLGLEKQSPPSTPSLNSSMTRRHHTGQSLEASTPGRKLGQKPLSLHPSNVQLRETTPKARDMRHQDDATSQQSKSNISLESHTDTEVTSIHQSDRNKGTHFKQHSQTQKNPAVGLSDDRSMAEPGKASSEQPSPVSVLDSTFYRDDSPSPVKKITNAFKDDEEFDATEYDPIDISLLTNITVPSLGAEIDHKRLENLKYLIQNHRPMSRTHEEPVMGPLCDSTNPDHIYISDIFLASGILRYLESAGTTIELHTSGCLINPSLFLALEEIRTDTKLFYDGKICKEIVQPKPDEKIQRKLVFDVVNEFLVQKIVAEDSFRQWFSPNKLAGEKPRGEQIFRELCSEVDQIQRKNLNGSLEDEDDSLRNILLEDFMDQAKNWTECDSEIPGVVLDVERLIFKDLITEIVNDDAAGLHSWSGRHCRQLFSEEGIR